jgi:hypothetical protein
MGSFVPSGPLENWVTAADKDARTSSRTRTTAVPVVFIVVPGKSVTTASAELSRDDDRQASFRMI